MSNTVRLLNGDCLQKLKELKDNSVDSVVTDPPYHLTSWDIQPKKKYKRKKKGFMGKEWDGLGEDGIGIANNPELWKEVLRVLKPGGHLLSFSHSRTYHRQAVAVEDAGFEIRDQIMWIYGSGFPKSHNIGKKVDEYEGWGTALKPAHEPIVMARKPFKETVAKNVLEHGTGGINIDGCRVGSESRTVPIHSDDVKDDTTLFGLHPTIQHERVETTQGRFPANIIFECTCDNPQTKNNTNTPYKYNESEYKVDGFINNIKPNAPSNYNDTKGGVIHTDPNCPCRILDEQSGDRKGWASQKHNSFNPYGGNALNNSNTERDGIHKGYNDTGGASRFFYCPKASKKDRNEGNIHPTVKPTDLMAYLVRLVTPKGGTVLDPFMGSGSTGKASVREGMNFIGIEREDEYMEIAKTRIEHEKGKHKHREFFE